MMMKQPIVFHNIQALVIIICIYSVFFIDFIRLAPYAVGKREKKTERKRKKERERASEEARKKIMKLTNKSNRKPSIICGSMLIYVS